MIALVPPGAGRLARLFASAAAFALLAGTAGAADIRTPRPPPSPRINGPDIFGVRPGAPFLYHIPVTGNRPMKFSVQGLPAGLAVNPVTGDIRGSLPATGTYDVVFQASNTLGTAGKKFRIVVGETIALTPPLGWNSWNCWRTKVTQDDVLAAAKGMASSGLIDHGWTYVNIDDTWQAQRGGPLDALQGNDKFPDMKGLCDAVHALGLKAGIYSTPWTTSYAVYPGGSAQTQDGTWSKPTIPKKGNLNKKIMPWAIGQYSFATNDARQWAAWGFDYLKYDWNPNELPETEEIYRALRSSGRDIVLSLSNSTPFKNIGDLSNLANAWRICGDIREDWQSVKSHGFGNDPDHGESIQRWQPYARPGHWNDPDMLEIGYIRFGPNSHMTKLTPDEQYTHITIWCMLSAPLLLGCDLQTMDDFTLNLITNDEVLAVDQDSLGKQAKCVVSDGNLRVYAKDLEDGSKAVALFNLGETPAPVTASWSSLGITGSRAVRDLWRQKDLGRADNQLQITVAPHGAEMVKLGLK